MIEYQLCGVCKTGIASGLMVIYITTKGVEIDREYLCWRDSGRIK